MPSYTSSRILSAALTPVLVFLPSINTSILSFIESSIIRRFLSMAARKSGLVLLPMTILDTPASKTSFTSSAVCNPPPVISFLLAAHSLIISLFFLELSLLSFKAPFKSTINNWSKILTFWNALRALSSEWCSNTLLDLTRDGLPSCKSIVAIRDFFLFYPSASTRYIFRYSASKLYFFSIFYAWIWYGYWFQTRS